MLAYSVDVVGDERYTLRFKDLRTGELYPDSVSGIAAGVTWATDNATTYYTTVDDAWRPDTVWRHRLGAAEPDEQVFHEPDQRFWVAVGHQPLNAYIVIVAGSAVTSEIRLAEAGDPAAEFTVVLPRRDGVEYTVEHAVIDGENSFLILHNDGAGELPRRGPGRRSDQADHLIPAREDVRLEGVDAFADRIVVHYRREGLPTIGVATGAGRRVRNPGADRLRLRTHGLRHGRQPELGITPAAHRGDLVRHPDADLRHRDGDRRAHPAAGATRPR